MEASMFGPSPQAYLETSQYAFFGLVDTGASANFVSTKLVKQLDTSDCCIETLSAPFYVYTANHEAMIVKDIIQIKCLVESEPITLSAFIADWLNRECILGVPFKEQFKDIAIPLISKEVKLVTTHEYIKVIGSNEARRLLNTNNVEAELLWITEEPSTTEPLIAENSEGSGVLKEFEEVIVDELPNDKPVERAIKHRIDLVPGTAPIARRAYRMSFEEKKELEKQLQALIDSGRVAAGTSPFAAPVLFVKKKDGSRRLCCDYRGLNNVTVKSKFPLPRIDDLFDMLQNASTFSQLDLVSGYHQVEVEGSDQYKTAFVTHEGQFIWKVMPFGLTNAPSTFQMLMNETLKGLIGKCVLVYLDDILIFSKNTKQHVMHLRLVLDRIKKAGLFAKRSKCHFFMKSVNFLGHTIDKDGIHVDTRKCDALQAWPTPTKPMQAASFLGTAGFYRKFIPRFSYIAKPLYEYSNSKRNWDEDCDKAFNELKSALTSAPVLLPFQEDKTVRVTTDASDFAVGAVLELLDDNKKVLGVVAYMSAKLSGAQLNWPVRKKEGYAIKLALSQWAHYLKGRKFLLNTDHQSLIYLHDHRKQSAKIERWLLTLSEFDFEIEHIKGPLNRADGLSRRPDLQKQISSNNKISDLESAPEINLWSISTAETMTIISAFTPELMEAYKQAYREDETFKDIYDILVNNKPVPAELRTIIKRYVVVRGLLYYGFTPNNRNRLCVPSGNLRRQLIQHAHDSPASSHVDATRTFLNLSAYYHWPNMLKTLEKYVKSCLQCQASKSRTGKQFGTYTPLDVADDRWRFINIDFLTGMEPDIITKNDSILVVIDRFSKMAHFIPTKKTVTTAEVADLFIKEVFRLHGAPQAIVSDRDSLFTSSLWERFAQRLGIKLNFTTSSNPQADGQVERLNRTLTERVRTLCQEQGTSWEKMLPLIEFSYNNSYQATIRATPFLASNTFHPRFVGLLNPLEPSQKDPLAKEYSSRKANNMLDNILTNAEALREEISRRIAKEQERISLIANKKMVPPPFKVGNQVLLHKSVYNTPGRGQKFQFLWYGPFEITEQISTNNFRLAIRTGTNKHDTFNAKSLKLFTPRLNDYGKTPPVAEDDIKARLAEITEFEAMHPSTSGIVVETQWEDCEPWDTVEIPLQWIQDGLPQERITYLKQRRRNRARYQTEWIAKRKSQLKKSSRNRAGLPRVSRRNAGRRRGNNRF